MYLVTTHLWYSSRGVGIYHRGVVLLIGPVKKCRLGVYGPRYGPRYGPSPTEPTDPCPLLIPRHQLLAFPHEAVSLEGCPLCPARPYLRDAQTRCERSIGQVLLISGSSVEGEDQCQEVADALRRGGALAAASTSRPFRYQAVRPGLESLEVSR